MYKSSLSNKDLSLSKRLHTMDSVQEMQNGKKGLPGAGSLANFRGSTSAYSLTIGSLRCFSEICVLSLSGDASLLGTCGFA